MAVRRGKSTPASRPSRFWRKGLSSVERQRVPAGLRLHRRQQKPPGRKLLPKHKESTGGLARRSIPDATYRLQFHGKFRFQDALGLVDYLRDLGISHCYASPIFTARKESSHGYDVCNFESISPESGGERGFEKFILKLHQAGIGLLLDIVANHMAADTANDWWRDVLENGRQSKYANWFDIDWDPPDPALKGKVLLPVLEDEYPKVIRSGKIRLASHDGVFSIQYHDRKFPLSPASRVLLEHEVAQRGNRKLLQKYNDHKSAAGPLALEQLLDRQNYRLAFWRLASEQLNYRRFFDITELVCLRMQEPEVFEAVHRLIFSLIKSGKVIGLRVDHPDGLWSPKQYFNRLQNGAQQVSGGPPRIRAAKKNPFYIVAEKILTRDERLPQDWPVAGTTGYDFLNRLNGLFVDSHAEQAFDRIYAGFTGESEDFAHAVSAGKRKILAGSMKTELNRLARRLEGLKGGQDFGFEEIRDALREVIVHFPVYRSYVTEKSTRPADAETNQINHAIAETLATHHEINGELLRWLRSILLLTHPKSRAPRFRDFVMHFQQLTGPVMAKGLEDTAFYNYNRLISLNEVGGDPGAFGTSVARFQEHNRHIAATWPHTLLTTATHDTKRGEDARARINVLSEFPSEWREALDCWSKLNADKKTNVHGQAAPAANDEYLFYQTLIGAWPPQEPHSAFSVQYSESFLEPLRERMLACMIKAIREAKARTSWLEPDPAYEEAMRKFVSDTLDESRSSEFLRDFQAFQEHAAFFGYLNSLSQLTLKMTSPGVPDLYQGCELWDFNLVDPDNRRPIDFDSRRRILQQLKSGVADSTEGLQRLLLKLETGAVKMYVLWRALLFRQSHHQLFQEGIYLPLNATGEKAQHIVAFARQLGKQFVITVAPRLVAGLCNKAKVLPLAEKIWGDTVLRLNDKIPASGFRNVLTGETMAGSKKDLRLSEILANFPVAILDGSHQ